MKLLEWLPELEERFGQPELEEKYEWYCILSIKHECGRKEVMLDRHRPLEEISGCVDPESA